MAVGDVVGSVTDVADGAELELKPTGSAIFMVTSVSGKTNNACVLKFEGAAGQADIVGGDELNTLGGNVGRVYISSAIWCSITNEAGSSKLVALSGLQIA